jgi:hypothetical protein
MKQNLKDSPVITIHMENADKQALLKEAINHGMQLATYCRMILLQTLNAGIKK